MALDKPTLTFELGLTAGFNDAIATVAWTDITPYVVSWGTNRGRNPAKPPAHFDPGVANLVLNNRDRAFDPTNTAGPYYPNLQPARVRLRIRASYLGVPYTVITGYVKRWPPEWTASATSVTKIAVVDALGAPLNLPQFAAGMYQTIVRHDAPKVWLRLGETGSVAADSTSHGLDGTYQGSPAQGLDGAISNDADKAVGTISSSRVSLPYKNLITAYPFAVECWIRCFADRARQRMIFSAYDGPSAGGRQLVQVFLNTDGKIWALVVNPLPATGTQINSSVVVDDIGKHHLVVVFVSSTDFHVYVDGADVTVSTATASHAFPDDLTTGYSVGNTPAVTFGDFNFAGANGYDCIDELAVYDYALPASRILRHFQAGAWPPGVGQNTSQLLRWYLDEADWPAADRTIAAGDSNLQVLTTAGGVVANIQKAEESEQGAVFVDEAGNLVFQGRHAILNAPYDTSQATFGQGVGDLPYEAPVTWGNDDAELFNEASGNRVGGATFTVVNAASQDPATGYGRRPLPAMSGLLNTNDAEVVDLLAFRVQKYGEPMPTVTRIRLHPAAVPAALYPVVLALGLRSRITVKVAPPGGGPVFSQESHIERISHDVDDKGDWWTTYDISAADTTSYLKLDDPVRGLLDSGNRVGF